jgi:chromosome segregation ATPase
MEQMQALGLSAAGWVKSHLDQDDRRVEARAKVLAERRDNLGREIERLEHLIEQRKQELKVPIDEEKARLQRKLEEWHQDEERRFQRRKDYNETRLENLRWEVRQEREKLNEMQGQIRELMERRRFLGDEVKKVEAYCEQVMQAAAMLKLLLDKWP